MGRHDGFGATRDGERCVLEWTGLLDCWTAAGLKSGRVALNVV